MSSKRIPKGRNSVTPYLVVDDATRAIDFYKQAFGATELMRLPGPNSTVVHADIKIGDSMIMVADQHEGSQFRSPKAVGGSPVTLMIYVDNVDEAFKRAVSLGAKETKAVENQFYGARAGNLVDPFGHLWTLATHVEEDLSAEEARKRWTALQAALPKPA
jgi:PhnB protein